MRLPFRIDFGRAALAVFLAGLLYFVALAETNPAESQRLNFTVPVQVVNVPSGLVSTNDPPEVSLWVQAQRNVFSRLRPATFTAQLNASSAHAGDNDGVAITVSSSDPDVRAVEAEPNTVRLHLEEVRAQTLPVRVNLVGQVPSGYQRGQPTSEPSTISVTGPASVVSRAAEAVVDVSVAVTVPINGVYTPRVLDDRGNELRDPSLRINPPSVTVSVPITQQTQYKEVGVRVITTGNPAPGYALRTLTVTPPTATLQGDPADLEGIDFVPTQPVDINGITTTIVRTVPLAPPPRTLLLQPGQLVTVTIQVTTLTVSQTVNVPPSIINLGPSVQLARTPPPIAVTISAPAPALSALALNPSDFRIVLDMAGKGPGVWDVDATVQRVPQGLTIESFEPRKVQVELREAPQPTPSATPPG